jgi:hypothetical protein
MRERPILFSAEMVRAILAGKKTQTRRIVKREIAPADGLEWRACLCREIDPSDTPCMVCESRFDPVYARAGDRLWVRETWAHLRDLRTADPGADAHARRCFYRAEHPTGLMHDDATDLRWRPSIFMPRELSRITLDVTSVRVERVQDISPLDAIDEGIAPVARCGCEVCCRLGPSSFCPADAGAQIEPFMHLWDAINGKRAPWSSNPWVWVIAFKRAEAVQRAA